MSIHIANCHPVNIMRNNGALKTHFSGIYKGGVKIDTSCPLTSDGKKTHFKSSQLDR